MVLVSLQLKSVCELLVRVETGVFFDAVVSFNLLMMVEIFRNNTTESAGYKHYPPSSQITSQWFGSFMANVTNKAFRGGLISGKAQGLVNGKSRQILRCKRQALQGYSPTMINISGGAAMIILPTEKVRTTLIDGLHFQRGVSYFLYIWLHINSLTHLRFKTLMSFAPSSIYPSPHLRTTPRSQIGV